MVTIKDKQVDPKSGARDHNEEVDTIPEVTSQKMKSALKKRYRRKESSRHVYGDSSDYFNDSSIDSSPLLSSTPPNVSRALIKLYPYLIVADKVLSLFTWSNDNHWPNYLVILFFIITTIYFDFIVKYFGQLVIIALLWLYSLMDNSVTRTVSLYPTLDDIIHMMGRVSKKADLILAPVRVLSVQDIKRLFFTITFFLPLYVVISLFIITPKKLFLLGGIYTLTFHSPGCTLIRRALWNIRVVRLFSFYVTGLDLGGINKHQGIFITVSQQMKNSNIGNKGQGKDLGSNDKAKAIRFTYALFENQRRWLGIGWTSAMLSYERAAWTDAYLNPAPSLAHFKLPDDDSDMKWQWIDENWSLDMTNDDSIQLPSTQPKLVSHPDSNAGYIYTDNTWTNPTTADANAKYTRRRRWVRTAELVNTTLLDVSGSKVLEYNDNNNDPNNEERQDSNRSTRSMSGIDESTRLSVPTKDDEDDKNRGRSVSFSNVQNVRIIPANESSFEETETETETESEDDSNQHCRNEGIDSLQYF